MGYKYFIFDFDGTLVDTLPDIVYYTNEILVEFGYPSQSREKIRKAIGRGVHELLKELGFREDDAQLEAAVSEFKKRYTKNPSERTVLFDGVVDMLKGDLAGCKKAIVTNKPHAITEQILVQLGLEKCFDVVIGEGGIYPVKPDPSGTLQVLHALGAKNEDAVFIGDSVVDYQTARNAGVDFVCMTYGYDDDVLNYKDVLFFENAGQWAGLLNFKK